MQPEPMSTSSILPWPSLSRTVRHLFPSAFRVNVTPVTPLPLVLPPSSPLTASPEIPVPLLFGDGVPATIALRRVDGAMELPVDDPTAGGADPADVVPTTGPAAMPPTEAGVCGAAVVCGAGLELSPVAFGVWLTEIEPAAVGMVVLVLLVSDCTTLGAPAELGALGAPGVAEAVWRTASEGFEPPLPLTGTVAVGAGCTVVLVAGAAVVGGAAGATVVTGALLTAAALLGVP